MNCPTCGAENEADARFCAECGAPLESQTDTPVEDNDDMTILSTVSEVSEEAKTVAVTQDDVAELAASMEQAEEAEFEPEASSPPPITGDVLSGEAGSKNNTQRYIVIGVLVFLVICCCCCVLAALGSAVAGEMDINNIDFSYRLFSTVEPFV